MPGPSRKPADERQRRNTYATVGVPAIPVGDPPSPPDKLRPSIAVTWLDFWRTPMAGLVAPSDLPALRRLWSLREESARAYELMLVAGDEGMVADPAWGRLAIRIDAEIRQLEDRFGLTPAARLRFVSELDDAQRAALSMQEREAAAGATEEGDDGAPLLADLEDGEDARPAGGDVDGAGARPRRRRSRG